MGGAKDRVWETLPYKVTILGSLKNDTTNKHIVQDQNVIALLKGLNPSLLPGGRGQGPGLGNTTI